jgi:plastocyanin
MAYIGAIPAVSAIGSTQIEDGSIALVDLSTAAQDALGKVDFYGFKKQAGGKTLTKTISVQSVGGSNKYFVDGVQQDSLVLIKGDTYIFDYSGASSHPFKISTTSDGTHGGGSEYTNGTSTANNALTFVVPNDAPAQLYYYCSSHSGMGGSIQVIENKTDLVIEFTNGADNVDVLDAANAENFDESFMTKKGLTFSINSNGDAEVSI